MEENSIPGFALGVVKNGRLVYAQGFGITELDSDQPVTPQSLFQACSTGKTVVAMAILQLGEQGQIGLDDPVTDYLPYFSMVDERYEDITIRHLLAHMAGPPGADDALIRFQATPPSYDDEALEEYVRGMSESELRFTPGEDYSYSSPRFDILRPFATNTLHLSHGVLSRDRTGCARRRCAAGQGQGPKRCSRCRLY